MAISGAKPAAASGMRATLQAPLANTTVRHCHVPLVGTRPGSRRLMCRTDVTVVCDLDRRRDDLGVTVDERDDLRHGPVAVRIVAFVAVAWQAALPVRRQQPERIPALGPPRVGDHPAFEHDVVDAALDRHRLIARPAWPAPIMTVVVLRTNLIPRKSSLLTSQQRSRSSD